MMIVRHANLQDLDAIFALIEQVDSGMTSLPKDRDVLKKRLQRIEDTLHNRIQREDHSYFFVLEELSDDLIESDELDLIKDGKDGKTMPKSKLVGISAIEVAIGSSEPFYNFKITTQVHSSKELDVYRKFDVLILSNDYTGHSELCSLFVLPDYRCGYNGKLISKARMMFMAAFPESFEPLVIAEMRGYFDEQGRSPFWDGFGAKFFNVDFAIADYLTGIGNKAFVAQLMPRFPFYVEFLPKEAQQVIGKVHPNTEPALTLLRGEGLKFKNNIDIFDGGPKIEAYVQDLRAVRDSQRLSLCHQQSAQQKQTQSLPASVLPYLITNDRYHGFRALVEELTPEHIDLVNKSIALPVRTAKALQLQAGDGVRVIPLNPPINA